MQKRFLTGMACLLLVVNTAICSAAAKTHPAATETTLNSVQLKGPTSDKAYAPGVAAAASGIVGDKLILAGGCNFQGNSLTKAAQRQFYKDIYMTTVNPKTKKVSWKKVGELPEGLANAAVAVSKDALYIIGGSTAKGDKETCLELKPDGKKVKCETISWLPVFVSNAGAAVIDNYLYVVGGLQNEQPSNAVYRLNLQGDKSAWEQMPSLPEEPRVQPLVVAQKDAQGQTALYVWAGFNGWGAGAELSCGGYKYVPGEEGWTGLGAPLKDEKRVYLGGGNAVAVGEDKIYVLGGFNYNVFLNNLRTPSADYAKHDAAWYKHNQEIYCYNTQTRKWSSLGSLPALGTVHAGIAVSDDAIYNIEGEIKPGTNTNLITRVNF